MPWLAGPYGRSHDICLCILSILSSFIFIIPVLIIRLVNAFNVFQKPIPPLLRADGLVCSKNEGQVTVLVTGVNMTKGLFLARAFYLAGCKVIAADFKESWVPASGAYSYAVHKFYKLSQSVNQITYNRQLQDIIEAHEVDMWISCSGVATAIKDADAAGMIDSSRAVNGVNPSIRQASTIDYSRGCKAFQFNSFVTSILDNKLRFMAETFNLSIPHPTFYTLPISFNVHDVENIASMINHHANNNLLSPTRFMIKSATMDDSTRGKLGQYSSETPSLTLYNELKKYGSSQEWILQELLDEDGEYCTHAVVVDGLVRAFTACESSSVLLHYQALPREDELTETLLLFTTLYAARMQQHHGMHGPFTGHLSLDFMTQTRLDYVEASIKLRPLPIECNPRCHTATINFRGKEKELVMTYLRKTMPNGEYPQVVSPSEDRAEGGYYWIAHDLVVLFLVPLISFLSGGLSFKDLVLSLLPFFDHVFLWKDPTFEWWDPLPWFVLNHGSWPMMLLGMARRGEKWSQLNVSTMKVFKTE